MDAQFQAPVHMELKRDFSNHKRASDGNITLPDGPLFERYQYLSPGTSPAYLGRVCPSSSILNNSFRPFYGFPGLFSAFIDPLRRHQWCRQPPNLLCRFRQGDGSCSTEEGVLVTCL